MHDSLQHVAVGVVPHVSFPLRWHTRTQFAAASRRVVSKPTSAAHPHTQAATQAAGFVLFTHSWRSQYEVMSDLPAFAGHVASCTHDPLSLRM